MKRESPTSTHEGDRHQEVLDEVIDLASRVVNDNSEVIRNRIEQETPWWIPTAVDDKIFKRVLGAIQRLLGASGDLGSRLGLDNKWMLQAVKAGGNYGEIFERNVGKASPLKLDRGLNATWSKGGLMYATPFK